MAPACLKTNHKFVVTVCVPRANDCETFRLQLCDFPADLVAKIVEGLSSGDRIRFGTTCTNNLSLVTNNRGGYQYQFREIDKLPWLATFTCHVGRMKLSLDFSLFEPLHVRGQPNYATYEILELNGEGVDGWSETKVKASRKGWLLCVWPKQGRDTGKETGLTCFLCFSPFNKRIIKLPDLDHSFENNGMDRITCRATFSTDPSSPDCVYFVLSQYNIPGKFRISTLDQTSQEWKTEVFYNMPLEFVSSVVYNEGYFYCLSSTGQLAAYDVGHRSFKDFIHYFPLSDLGFRGPGVRIYMVMCEGKLILVVTDRNPNYYEVEMIRCDVFEFSCSRRIWVKKTSLGNHALFLGQSSFSVRVSDSLCPSNIADRAYFYKDWDGERNLFYYSLKDGQFHAAKGSDYWSSDLQGGIWIEPPCLTSSSSGFA